MRTKVKHDKNAKCVSAREALDLMKKSLSLFMEMDIKTSIYLEKMYAYKKYCKKGTKAYWQMAIYSIMMAVNDRDLDELEEMLNCYECVGGLLQRLQSEPVTDVALSYSQQNLDENKRAYIELLILEYAELGLEFDEAISKIYAEKEQSKGISKAEDVMDDFMQKLNNNEFPKDTEPKSSDEFIPTDELAEKILDGYQEILEDIKQLKLN